MKRDSIRISSVTASLLRQVLFLFRYICLNMQKTFHKCISKQAFHSLSNCNGKSNQRPMQINFFVGEKIQRIYSAQLIRFAQLGKILYSFTFQSFTFAIYIFFIGFSEVCSSSPSKLVPRAQSDRTLCNSHNNITALICQHLF